MAKWFRLTTSNHLPLTDVKILEGLALTEYKLLERL
jgi:hypothetical protein